MAALSASRPAVRPLPPAPSDGVPGSPRAPEATLAGVSNGIDAGVREEIRKLIAEELRDMLKR